MEIPVGGNRQLMLLWKKIARNWKMVVIIGYGSQRNLILRVLFGQVRCMNSERGGLLSPFNKPCPRKIAGVQVNTIRVVQVVSRI